MQTDILISTPTHSCVLIPQALLDNVQDTPRVSVSASQGTQAVAKNNILHTHRTSGLKSGFHSHGLINFLLKLPPPYGEDSHCRNHVTNEETEVQGLSFAPGHIARQAQSWGQLLLNNNNWNLVISDSELSTLSMTSSRLFSFVGEAVQQAFLLRIKFQTPHKHGGHCSPAS